MRPKGSAEALEMRRQIAAKLLQEGKGLREVARVVGASPSSVVRWKRALEEGGLEALKAKRHPDRQPGLTAEQKRLFGSGAKKSGPRSKKSPRGRLEHRPDRRKRVHAAASRAAHLGTERPNADSVELGSP